MDDLKLYGRNEKQVDALVNTVHIFSKNIGMKNQRRKNDRACVLELWEFELRICVFFATK